MLLYHWELSSDDCITKAITVPSLLESNNIAGINAFATILYSGLKLWLITCYS